ncbi:MAG: DUF5320 domain-containing protein [Candidatus Gygaella obscura]|nr:DUF5320 domain-containing protein [Candidatus Gygaella obscura]
MPRGDGTGPAGQGPTTGRGLGYCAGFSASGYANSGFGRGYGMGAGRGMGRGRRNWFYQTGMPGSVRAGYGMPAYGNPNQFYAAPSKEEQLDILKNEAESLKVRLKDIDSQLDSLSKEENK